MTGWVGKRQIFFVAVQLDGMGRMSDDDADDEEQVQSSRAKQEQSGEVTVIYSNPSIMLSL